MLPDNHKSAKELGLTHYFTGKPCKYGHVTLRSAHDRACLSCLAAKMRNRRAKRNAEIRALDREYYKRHSGKIRAKVAKRKAAVRKALPKWANLIAIRSIYENCPDGMEVDHIIPILGKYVCGLHVENNLQYLTPNQNRSKNNKYYFE